MQRPCTAGDCRRHGGFRPQRFPSCSTAWRVSGLSRLHTRQRPGQQLRCCTAHSRKAAVMNYAKILLDSRDGIATITLNRPEAYNALDLPLATEFHDAIVTCSEDEAVRVVVVTGSGRAFCAGGDVKGFSEQLDNIGKHVKLLTLALHAAVSRMVRMPKPTITAVNGVAAGGGLGLSLAGDLIVATESARFTMAYTQIGASPDGSSRFFLPRPLGGKTALELTFLNLLLSARETMG